MFPPEASKEAFRDAVTRRAGASVAARVAAIEESLQERLAPILAHRSVRSFDSSRSIPRELVEALVVAGQSAATSSNLQLYSLVSVQEPARRAQIATLCAEQRQVREAGWFFAVCLDHHRLRVAGEAVDTDPTGLDYVEYLLMSAIDAALFAERFVVAAESIGLGICYIGALRNRAAEVAELLALPDGVVGLFGLCLGVPAAGHELHREEAIKPRLAPAGVWFEETYPSDASTVVQQTQAYDERMRPHYEGRGQKGTVTWSMRSARRADDEHLTGREALKPFLESRGFMRR